MPPSFTQYCPVCDHRAISTRSYDHALEVLKKHVQQDHEDYDQQWYESYPEDN